MNTRGQVAGEVRAAMARAQVNQTTLAEKISMSRASLSDSLNGKRAFNTDELAEIGQALGVNPLAFLLPVATTAISA